MTERSVLDADQPNGGRSAVPVDKATSRKTTRAAFFGFFVDYYDIYLPVVALAPAIMYFQPADLPPATKTTLFYLTLIATLIGRPLGSIIFGSLADSIGRRKSTLIAVAGFTTCTFAMAVLPGHATMGYWAIALLTLLRFIGGVFMGGEYAGANPLALEQAQPERRGMVGAVIGSAYPWGFIAISIATLVMLTSVGDGAYLQWGWRVPFAIGGVLGIILYVQFARVPESEAWLEAKRQNATSTRGGSLRTLFRGVNGRKLTQVIVVTMGMWWGSAALVSATPPLLQTFFELPSQQVIYGLLIANIALATGYLVYGAVGQRIGRRRALMVAGALDLVIALPAFYLMIRAVQSDQPLWLVMTYYTIALVVAMSPFGIATTYIIERFAVGVRAAGYGTGYALAGVIPSLYAFHMLYLDNVMPYEFTPVVFLLLAGLLTLIGAAWGPETRDVDLTRAE
ncbi:MFS transporter [Mycobacterium sp. NPDC003449]